MNQLNSAWIDSPLGLILAIANEEKLYLLEFSERKNLAKELARLKLKLKLEIIEGRTKIIDSIEKELFEYFSGKLKEFKTPIHIEGTDFQKKAWQELLQIPYGETRSYMEQAKSIHNPKGYRAVANANGCNQLAIIIPCHRIINTNGNLGGYAGGVAKKKWLLEHEKKFR